MAHDSNRQASDKFRLKAEVDEVLGLAFGQNSLGSLLRTLLSAETNRRFSHASPDNFLQSLKGAANNKQNVLGVNRGWRFATSLSEIHHRLDLSGNIVLGTSRHLGFFHELQEVGLHTPPADIAAAHVAGRC